MENLKKLSELTEKQIGHSEEDVKINFIVPFLEAFGHHRLNYEHKFKDIIIRHEKTNLVLVIIETKKYHKPLDPELGQLERYCNEDRPLLGIISNGNEIRIYSPDWKRQKLFSEKAIYIFKRENLADENLLKRLELILRKEKLYDDSAEDNINEREKEIRLAFKNIEDKKSEINSLIEEKKKEINTLENNLVLFEKTILSDNLIPNSFRPVIQNNIKEKDNEIINPDFDFDIELTHKKKTNVKNRDFLFDYIFPVLKGIKNGQSRVDAVKSVAKKLNVEVTTVSDRCTRKLGININEFDNIVKNGTIREFLIERFPDRENDILTGIE